MPALNEAFKQSVYWHFSAQLVRMRKLPREEVKRIADYASGENLNFPLHMAGPTDRFKIPDYAEDLSGAQVVAIMLAGLWILMDERKLLMYSLIQDWPDLPLFARLTGETRSIVVKRKRKPLLLKEKR